MLCSRMEEGGGAVYQTQQFLGAVIQTRDQVTHKAPSVSERRMRDARIIQLNK